MRIVVYAEGAGETGGTVTRLPQPGRPLTVEMLGAAHALIERAVESTRSERVQFEAPLRVRGRLAVGSDLLHPTRLRQLLSWARPTLQPDLAIVLVDADGDNQRRTTLQAATAGLLARVLVAVAKQEFEAWLLADPAAVTGVLGLALDPLPALESLPPRKAKGTLDDLVARSGKPAREARREIAATCDLDSVAQACRTFELLLADLRSL